MRSRLKSFFSGNLLPRAILACSVVCSLLLSAAMTTPVQADSVPALPANTSADLDDVVERIRAEITEAAEGKEVGLVFTRLDADGNEVFSVKVNEQELYPVASTFKAFVVLYYFLNTPQSDWNYEYGSNVYSSAVYSNNTKTAAIIAEVWQRNGGVQGSETNALEMFNDFLPEIGINSGLYAWGYGRTAGHLDERFRPTDNPDAFRAAVIHGNTQIVANLFTSEEVANGLQFIATAESNPRWESDEHFRAAITATRDILGIPSPRYTSPLERFILNQPHYGKDGALPANEMGFRVLNDATVIPLNWGGSYVISFMSSGEGDETSFGVLEKVATALNDYEAAIYIDSNLELRGESAPIKMDAYNYGFIRVPRIELFAAPDENAERIDNPWRINLRLRTAWMMKGAMLRFLPVDENWALLVRDDEWDDLYERRDVYFRIADVMVVDTAAKSAPIGYVTDAPEGTSKFMIVDVFARQVILFEGTTPILRTPTVLNTNRTPRGTFYIRSRYMTRNMLPWVPGVPYSNFIDEAGNAIHGAPWQHWTEGITEPEVARRFTHGCINIPNWTWQVGEYNLPVDEFIFRWSGGMVDPSTTIADRETREPGEVVMVYLVNNLFELENMRPPRSLVANGQSWRDVLAALETFPVSAPESFFVKK